LSKPNPNLGSDAEGSARQSLWRQGKILTPDCAAALQLSTVDEKGRIFVVVSHDCDLAERDLKKEPFAEVVEAFLIKECDDGFTHSKSTRILHLEAEKDGQHVYLELQAITKRSVDKVVLESFKPSAAIVLIVDEGNALSHWLAARYKRASFPNALLHRLGNKVLDSFRDVGKKNPRAILGIFLDYDPEDELEDDREPYELWVYVIYSSEIKDAKETASEIAIGIKQKFERIFIDSHGSWQRIELRECVAIADTQFSLYEARRLKFFRLDHVSLRQSPPAELPDVS
jgi:hypothetical protein